MWLANETGIVGCLDPQSGKVRASERVPPSRMTDPLAADPIEHRVFALEGEHRRLVQLMPPKRC